MEDHNPIPLDHGRFVGVVIPTDTVLYGEHQSKYEVVVGNDIAVITIPKTTLEMIRRGIISLEPIPLKDASENGQEMLEIIFWKQEAYMRLLTCHPDQIKNWAFGTIKEFMAKICWAMLREIVEACDYLPWRWWNKHKNVYDHDKFRLELVDCLHFLIELCILAGIGPRELFDAYLEKNQINVENAVKEQGGEIIIGD